jgi:predicted DNA-binding protein
MSEIEWLRMVKKSLECDLAAARKSAESNEKSARFWREAFERIAADVGDLMLAARAGEQIAEEHLAGVLDREALADGP